MAGNDQFLSDFEIPTEWVHEFSEDAPNGGTIVAIAGDDYVVIATDTRLSSGDTIHTHAQKKLFKLSSKTVLGSAGCWCDILSLTSIIHAHMTMHELDHHETTSTESAAQMLSTLRYNTRLFPYYVSNVLAGLDKQGKGVVYSYDANGHCESVACASVGTSEALLKPVLDNLIGVKNDGLKPKVDQEHAVCIATDTFVSAAERYICIGDLVLINIINRNGIEEKAFALRKD